MVNWKLAYYFCGNRIVQQLCPSVPEIVQCHTTEGTSSRLYPLHCHHWILFQSIFQLKQSFQPASELFKHKHERVLCTGLLTDCFKTSLCFPFRFWPQIYCLFFFRFVFNNSLHFRLLVIRAQLWETWLPCFNLKFDVFLKPSKTVISPTRNDQNLIKEQR